MTQQELNPSVLGRILLIQSALHALVSDTQRAAFVTSGLARIPGIRSAQLCWDCDSRIAVSCNKKNDEDSFLIDIRTTLFRYGCLRLEVNDEKFYHLYAPYIEGLANVVALNMETARQHAELEEAQRDLENRVAARTSELAEVNEKLKEREHFISRVIGTAPMLLYIFDIAKQVNVFCNDHIFAILGYTPNEVLEFGSRMFQELLHPEDIETLSRHQDVLKSLADGKIVEVEYRMRHKDGSFRILHSWESIFARNEEGFPVRTAVAALDVTEQREAEKSRKTLEEQFRAAQRMDAVGRLAGGIAHDFNNLLTIINSYAEVGMEELNPSSPIYGQFEQILTAGERAAALTRRLLAFSRKQVLKPEVVNLNVVILDMEKMLQRVIGEDVSLTVTLEKDLGNVSADVSSLEQVIMNLAVNARDAMRNGGQLTIQTRQVVLPEQFLKHNTQMHSGAYAVMIVSDTGIGMGESTKQRIFEPFFTTKEIGSGIGLGLSTVWGIVKQSGGDIWVESTIGKGSTFEIYWPLVEGTAEAAGVKKAVRDRSSLSASETILLVEDESAVRVLAEQILRAEGYTVISAKNADEATAFFAQQGESIDLMLTDIIMPGMNGKVLAERLLSICPHLKVLYMSGYTADLIENPGMDNGICFLAKPFAASELRAAVRRALDNSTASSFASR